TPGLNSFRLNAFFPGAGDDRTDSFTYRATDGVLESSTATVRITVRAPNSPPAFSSQPVTKAATGVRYAYVAQAFDSAPSDVFTFSLPAAPQGMSIDPSFGLIQWTPTDAKLGQHHVVVKIQDVQGAFALQAYDIDVVVPVTVPNVLGK